MKDLRDALKNFINHHNSSIQNQEETVIDLKLFQSLVNEYKLHFVEPKADKEFQDWQDVCFPRF